MKKLDSKTLKYLAKTYGKNFAGDESDPSASEVKKLDTIPTPPPGYDGSPDANPNIAISPDALAKADLNSSDNLNAPAASVVSDPVVATDAVPSGGATGSWDNAAAPLSPGDQTVKQPEVTPNDFQKAGVPDIEGSLLEEKAANQAKAKAEADQGAAEVLALKAGQDAIAKLPTANDISQKYKAKDDALFQAYQQNKLDPNRYWESRSTGQKVTSGIALILGGIGSGLTHQPNLAAKMIDDSINRDIDAQKNSQDQQRNLWKMNKEEYGNDLAANLATQNQLLTGVKLQLGQAASAAKGPMAQANAQSANALIDQKLAENRFKLSLMQPTSDSFGIDPAKKVSWLVPASHQQKVFDEIDAAQNTTRNAKDIISSFDNAAKEVRPWTSGTKTSLTAFVPGMDSPNQKALHALLGPTFKDVEGTVRQAAMDNMFKNTTPQFGDDASTIARKRDALIGYMTSKSSAPTASGFGINLNQYPSTNVKGAVPAAPGSPEAKQKLSNAATIKYDPSGKAWTRNPQGVVIPAPVQGMGQ